MSLVCYHRYKMLWSAESLMAFWERPVVITVCRPTMKSHGKRWLLKRSVCWICTASVKFIARGVAGRDVTEILGAVERSPAGAVGETCDEGQESAGQGPAGGEEGEEANAKASVEVFATRQPVLRSNLFRTLINWLTSQLDRTELRRGITWLAVSSKAIAQACLPNNGIAAYRYHVNQYFSDIVPWDSQIL